MNTVLIFVALCSSAAAQGPGIEVMEGGPSGPPPEVFKAAREKTPGDLMKLLEPLAGDEAARLAMVNAVYGGKHPIDIAVMNGNAAVVRYLVEQGAQLQNPGANGQPPVHLAAWRGHAHLVELLLSVGADPLLKNNAGETALQASEHSMLSKVHDQVAEMIALHLAGDGDGKQEL